jgi:hypothetical protein
MHNTYVIYYGWLSDDESGAPNADALRIRDARVPLLVANYWTAAPQRHRNLSARVLSALHQSHTKVFSYVSTDYGAVDLEKVQASVTESIAGGVDGIFLDEAPSSLAGSKLDYYRTLADLARASGKEVIVNPGVSRCDESIMQVADYVMLEHEWRNFHSDSAWAAGYDDDRFMGVSSNEGNELGYPVTEARAIADTREAWDQRHIGWHTSTDQYVELPEWFEDYVGAVRT